MSLLFLRQNIILSLGFLIVFCNGISCNTAGDTGYCGYTGREISCITRVCEEQPGDTLLKMVRFDHSQGGSEYFSLSLSRFHSNFERAFFYDKAWLRQIYMADKSAFYTDSAIFIAPVPKDEAWQEFRELLLETQAASVAFSEQEKHDYVSLSPFYKVRDNLEVTPGITPLASSNASGWKCGLFRDGL